MDAGIAGDFLASLQKSQGSVQISKYLHLLFSVLVWLISWKTFFSWTSVWQVGSPRKKLLIRIFKLKNPHIIQVPSMWSVPPAIIGPVNLDFMGSGTGTFHSFSSWQWARWQTWLRHWETLCLQESRIICNSNKYSLRKSKSELKYTRKLAIYSPGHFRNPRLNHEWKQHLKDDNCSSFFKCTTESCSSVS